MDLERIRRELARLVPEDRVLHTAAARRAYDCDAYTLERAKPSVVVLPETTEEVQAVVRWCVANGVPFTPRGAGTGLSGGALPVRGGVVVSLKRMGRILDIDLDNRIVHAEAGATNLQITEAVSDQGFHFAPDPSSQSVATLGGNIAENSGGPHCLKVGVTAPHVLQVRLVDPQGEVLTVGSLVPGAPGYDLLGLLVGSEGTMGIVTEAWVKLSPLPRAVETALAAFPTIRSATETAASIIAEGIVPVALEMMDKNILVALKAAFGLEFPEGAAALLLIECDGEPEDVAQDMADVHRLCVEKGAIEVRVANEPEERAKLWTARKKGVGAMGRLAPTIVTHDGTIPRSKLPEMLEFVYDVSERHGVKIANIFHAGDGNLHPCMYFDERDPAQLEAAGRAAEEIIRHCLEIGGSITGEHGVGIEKLPMMRLMFTPDDLETMDAARRIFDERGLCNPGKVLPMGDGPTPVERQHRGGGG